jgi:hypothetical protein
MQGCLNDVQDMKDLLLKGLKWLITLAHAVTGFIAGCGSNETSILAGLDIMRRSRTISLET